MIFEKKIWSSKKDLKNLQIMRKRTKFWHENCQTLLVEYINVVAPRQYIIRGPAKSENRKCPTVQLCSFFLMNVLRKIWHNTVKLARAKLPANAGNFTCSSQVKRSLAQFTCVTCSLPVNTGKFTFLEAASTSRRTHANCLRKHVNLPEYHKHFTGSFTCFCRQKYMQLTNKNTGIAGKNTRTIAGKKICNSTQNYLQLQAICYHTSGKFTCKLQVS